MREELLKQIERTEKDIKLARSLCLEKCAETHELELAKLKAILTTLAKNGI